MEFQYNLHHPKKRKKKTTKNWLKVVAWDMNALKMRQDGNTLLL